MHLWRRRFATTTHGLTTPMKQASVAVAPTKRLPRPRVRPQAPGASGGRGDQEYGEGAALPYRHEQRARFRVACKTGGGCGPCVARAAQKNEEHMWRDMCVFAPTRAASSAKKMRRTIPHSTNSILKSRTCNRKCKSENVSSRVQLLVEALLAVFQSWPLLVASRR